MEDERASKSCCFFGKSHNDLHGSANLSFCGARNGMNDPHLHSAKAFGNQLLPARRSAQHKRERGAGAKVTGAAALDFLHQPPGWHEVEPVG